MPDRFGAHLFCPLIATFGAFYACFIGV